MKTKLLAAILFLAPVLIYVWQNGTPITIQFLKWQYPVPQALLLLSTLLVGVILGLILSHAWKNKEKNRQKKADKKAKKDKKAEDKLKKQQEKHHKSDEQEENTPFPDDEPTIQL